MGDINDGAWGYRIGGNPSDRMAKRAARQHRKAHRDRRGCGKSLGLAVLVLAGGIGGLVAVIAHWPT
jgi:hypothetical protein